MIRYQVFVANPKKPPQIESILRRNKDKLLVFLKNFHNDKEGAHLLSPLYFSFDHARSPLLRRVVVRSHRRTVLGTSPPGRISPSFI